MRKLVRLATLLACTAALGSLAGPAAAQGEGDVDGDGRIGPVDLMLVRMHLLGETTLQGAAAAAADVAPVDFDGPNGDGVIGTADLAVLAQILAEPDYDGDGLSDEFEASADTSPLDPDSDGSTPDGELDTDQDGLTHLQEFQAGTDPLSDDTDGDGLLDPWELEHGFDPLDGSDGAADPDADGLDNVGEQAAGTDPLNGDTDWDGTLDGVDLTCPLDPENDEDGDGICHAVDNCPVNANPSQADGDGDGLGDACDPCPAVAGSNPDHDGFCGAADKCPNWPNVDQTDSNGDGIGDVCQCGDVDGDGDVTQADATHLGSALSSGDLFSLAEPALCDVNNDGQCSEDDLVHLDNHLNGLAPGIRASCPVLSQVVDKALTRLGYGSDPWTRQRVFEIDSNGYILEQLDPQSIPDPVFRQERAAYGEGARGSLGKSIEELFEEFCGSNCPNQSPRQVASNMSELKFLRSIHSRRQLEAVLMDFWLNHFNVNARGGHVRWAIQHYEQEAIKPHILGRFEDLVLAVAQAPAMLDYLDLRHSQEGNLNENFARELMELHTVGPDDTYDEGDVQEAARILTGYSYDTSGGETPFVFEYRPSWHDDGTKTITFEDEQTGVITDTWTFDGTQGCDGEVPSAFDDDEAHILICLLSRHERTAERISRKLLSRFVSEDPPQAVVDEMVNVWMSTDGDLHAVLSAMLLSDAFNDALHLGLEVKRPSLYSASLVRALGPGSEGTGEVLTGGWGRWDDGFHGILGDLAAAGEHLFHAGPPTGYPEASIAWASAGGFLVRANQATRLLSELPDPVARFGVPPGATDAQIVSILAEQLVSDRLTVEERAELEALLGDMGGASLEERVRVAAATMLATPGFLTH